MSYIRERIEKTIRAIAKAEANGKDSTIWQDYLTELINKLDKPKVKAKIGKFGFCTCLEGSGLCCGCWKIKHSCECEECEVDPEIEITRQFQNRANDVH